MHCMFKRQLLAEYIDFIEIINMTCLWILFLFCFANATNQDAYAKLKKTMEIVKGFCGQVCDTTLKGQPGKYFDELKKDINCPVLFKTAELDYNSDFKEPPMRIPKWLLNEFTYQGRVEVDYREYFDDTSGAIDRYNFSKAFYKEISDNIDSGTYASKYGKSETDRIYNFMKDRLDLKGKIVLVVGSIRPWIEIMALKHGAKHVYTLEYVKIQNEIEQITTLLPEELNDLYSNGQMPGIDVVISWSSIEHAGLGRYGDGLNPWGDLITMAKAWCLLKPKGQALIGMPVGPGKDVIFFNGCRAYGPVMLPHLFANFKQVYTELNYDKYDPYCFYCYQELFLLEKNN